MNVLFSPLDLGRMSVANRVVLPPMATTQAGDDGLPTAGHVDHYSKFARHGVGLIILEHTYVRPDGRAHAGQLGLGRGDDAGAWRRLAAGAGAGESLAVLQLTHCGSSATAEVAGQVLGPSAVMHPRGRELPRQLDPAQLQAVQEAFVGAAVRAVEAGFAGVELHGAHGYLFNQFLSPLTNTRKDGYGGDLECRARFPLEVTRAVRAALGPEPLLLYRLGADDLIPGGFTVAESCTLAGWLEAAGVDAIDVSGGLGGYPREVAATPLTVGGVAVEPLYLLPLASAVSARVQVPVIYTGGVSDPQVAELILRAGHADLVGVGRAQLADPGWIEGARRSMGVASKED